MTRYQYIQRNHAIPVLTAEQPTYTETFNPWLTKSTTNVVDVNPTKIIPDGYTSHYPGKQTQTTSGTSQAAVASAVVNQTTTTTNTDGTTSTSTGTYTLVPSGATRVETIFEFLARIENEVVMWLKNAAGEIYGVIVDTTK